MPLPKAPTKPATLLVPSPSEPAPTRSENTRRADSAGTGGRENPLPRRLPAGRRPRPTSPSSNRNRSPARRQEAAHRRAPEALRARHQRADARFDQPVPVRGTRRLPADDDAGGTRLAQEGNEGGCAQRAPGFAHARRAGRGCKTPIEEGIPLGALGNKDASGRLFFQTQAVEAALPASLPAGKADNQILGVVRALKDLQPSRDVVLVSKDINMRVKARALGLPAEDYTNDKVLEDTDILYTGVMQLPANFWDKNGKGMESWQHGGYTYYRITGPIVAGLLVNQFVYLENGTTLLRAGA